MHNGRIKTTTKNSGSQFFDEVRKFQSEIIKRNDCLQNAKVVKRRRFNGIIFRHFDIHQSVEEYSRVFDRIQT
jgi:hypothetical protein